MNLTPAQNASQAADRAQIAALEIRLASMTKLADVTLAAAAGLFDELLAMHDRWSQAGVITSQEMLDELGELIKRIQAATRGSYENRGGSDTEPEAVTG